MTSNIVLDKKGVRINGEYKLLLCASLFYFRIPMELWKDRIVRLKAAGYNCVDVYFPWNFHELAPESWDFEGRRDAGRFLDMLWEEGIYVVARPGPYICSEWDGGGIPAWILASGVGIRQNSQPFIGEVRKWYDKVLPIIAARQMGQGGTVILVQLENELDFFDCPDPKSYMEELAAMARAKGITVPLFGCAGQCDASGATGLARDVYNTYNFYPSPIDPYFDQKCRSIANTLFDMGQPLLITETNREHNLLRRELASGAKLLGAYNQVGGSNFGFTSSINNWGVGSPLSFISTDYDFASMINAAGEYNAEALEGRLMRGLIDTLGESLAAALPADDTGITVQCSFPTIEGKAAVLELDGGGLLLCIPNLSGNEGTAKVHSTDFTFEAVVGAFQSPLYPVGVPTDKTGMPGIIKYASAELIAMEAGMLLFYADAPAKAVLVLGGKSFELDSTMSELTITLDGKTLFTAILSREDAARYMPDGRWEARISGGSTSTESITSGIIAKYEPEWVKTDDIGALHMEARGLYRGFALYETQAEPGQALLVEGAADIITTFDSSGKPDTRISGGQWQLYAGANGSQRRFTVESWGHSNFDDSRLNSLRLASRKGIDAIYGVLGEQPLGGQFRFRQMDTWLPDRLEYKSSPLDAILDLNAWNTTRKPVYALYYTDISIQPGSTDLALHLQGASAEAALYVNGARVGLNNPNDPWVPIHLPTLNSERLRLELLCRKRDWYEPAGEAILYHLKRLPVSVSGFGEEQLAKLSAPEGLEATLPVHVDSGGSSVMQFEMDSFKHSCAYVRVSACSLKITAMFNGKVVGRIFGQYEGRPFITGGDSEKFYIPGPWYAENGNKLVLFLEPTDDHPVLTSLTLEYAELGVPD